MKNSPLRMKHGALRAMAMITAGSLSTIIGGCAHAGVQAFTPNATDRAVSTFRAPAPAEVGPRMLPSANTQALLYVSDFNQVVVYSYPGGSVQGRLRGFSLASGMCVDAAQNVYVADLGHNSVDEYAHGRPKRIKALHPGSPSDCSLDPTTGNLAVTDLQGHEPNGKGSVAIYEGARGNPKYYTAPGFDEYFFCGYDDKGDLFIDGISQPGSGHVIFAELPHGGGKFSDITLNQYIGWPGGVQWDGKHVAVGDQTVLKIYEFDVSGSKGSLVGTTTLSGAGYVQKAWIQGATIVAPVSISGREGQVRFYNYPAGGKALKILKNSVEAPRGAVVSGATE